MITLTRKNQVKEAFDDKLLLFLAGDKIPFAYRSPTREATPYLIGEGTIIDKIGKFEISKTSDQIICRYNGTPSGFALITPTCDDIDLFEKETILIDYLRAAHSLELSLKNINIFEDLISRLAEKCGCLTDIYREESLFLGIGNGKTDSSFLALSLPIIALMYRRISALRGFNFKIAFSESVPCLVFSAKVLLSDRDSHIPERDAIGKIVGEDSLSFVHKLTELGEVCESGNLYRLSVAICPQSADPKGILRAPEWKKHTENILSRIELDVPGRF